MEETFAILRADKRKGAIKMGWNIVAKTHKDEVVCGMNNQIMCNDLKTLRGVIRRYEDWIRRKNKQGKIVEIYSFADAFKENTYRKVSTFMP